LTFAGIQRGKCNREEKRWGLDTGGAWKPPSAPGSEGGIAGRRFRSFQREKKGKGDPSNGRNHSKKIDEIAVSVS